MINNGKSATSTPSMIEPTKRNATTSTRDLCTYRQVAITKQQFITFMYILKLSHIFMYKFNGFSFILTERNINRTSVFAWHFATETKEKLHLVTIFNSYNRYITNRISGETALRLVSLPWTGRQRTAHASILSKLKI